MKVEHLTQMTEYLQAQSWQIATLVAIVALVTWALRNKSAHVRYLLWLIVLAKCLVPPLVAVSVPILREPPSAETGPAPPAQTAGRQSDGGTTPSAWPVNSHGQDAHATSSQTIASTATPLTPPPAEAGEKPNGLSARQWLGLAWILGATLFVLGVVIKALRTNFWVHWTRQSPPAEAWAWMENFFRPLGLRRCPKVWLVDGIGQPFVWGLLRGGIYLPVDFVTTQSGEHRRGVLGHELSHVLRFDAGVNVLQVLAQAIFWFHPFVWWANKRIRAEREKCCDEMAIARLNALPKEYTSAIVNTLASEHESGHPVPSLAVVGALKNIEERIRTIMKPGKRFYKRPSWIAIAVALVIAAVTLPTVVVFTARAENGAKLKSGKKADESTVTTIEDLQKEYERRILSEVEAKGEDMRPEELQTLAVKIAKETFGRHPEVLRAQAEKALKKLPKIDAQKLEGHVVKHKVDLLEVMREESYKPEDVFLLRGWQPEWVAGIVVQMARARLWGIEQFSRRAILLQFVPDKVFVLEGQKRTTLAIRSLRDYVLVEVELAESGVFLPVSLRWLLPKGSEKGAPAIVEEPRG